ncbi:MAG: class I SAM-dependent methyltransferase [Planctomycetota bacterium]
MRFFLLRLTKQGRRAAYLAELGSRLERDWRGADLGRAGELVDVPCRECPKFARFPPRCTVPFGSRVRSCVCAWSEYLLRGVAGQLVLELGCGESSFARACVLAAGGRWIGVDQRAGKDEKQSVRSIAARVQRVPFRDESFDVVFGSQTLEHWEDLRTPQRDCDCTAVMGEIWRVLKPGGWFGLDAPIHLHGAPEFIRGDLDAIRRIFARHPWQDLRTLAWRRRHQPLPPARAPARESDRWPAVLLGASPAEIAALGRRSAWILGIRGVKPP